MTNVNFIILYFVDIFKYIYLENKNKKQQNKAY